LETTTTSEQRELDLAIDLLSDMICRFLALEEKQNEKKQILQQVFRLIEEEEEELLDYEMTVELLGTEDFIRVA
jgi:hypothetical protein